MDMNELLAMTPTDLEHHGVKGMKWGVSKAKKAGSAVKTRVKEEVASKKREYGWNKQYKNRSNMSTKELQKLTTRVTNENALKRNATTKSQKKAYRNRANLSDQRLNALVKRVNLEANFKKQAGAVRTQDRKRAKKVVNTLSSIPMNATPQGVAISNALKFANNVL